MIFRPSHFTAVLLFALLVSTVLGITQRETAKRMFRYGAATFGLLTGSAIVLSWLMFLLAR
jgi:Na+/H+-dicarboxylate symporter